MCWLRSNGCCKCEDAWTVLPPVSGPLEERIHAYQKPGGHKSLKQVQPEMGNGKLPIKREPGGAQRVTDGHGMKVKIQRRKFDRLMGKRIPILPAQDPAQDCLEVALVGVFEDKGRAGSERGSNFSIEGLPLGQPCGAACGSWLLRRRRQEQTACDRHRRRHTGSVDPLQVGLGPDAVV